MAQKISFLMAGLMLVVSASHDVALADEIKKPNPPGVVSSPVNSDPEATLRYWTPERMRSAKPMDMTVRSKPAPASPHHGESSDPGVAADSDGDPPEQSLQPYHSQK